LRVSGRGTTAWVGWSEKDEGGHQLMAEEKRPSAQGMPNYDHRVALTVDFSAICFIVFQLLPEDTTCF